MNHHKGLDIKAQHAEQIIILELCRHCLGRLLGVEKPVFLPHAAGFVDHENYSPIFLFFPGLFKLHGQDRLDRRLSIAARGKTPLAPKHDKAISLGYVPLDPCKISGGEFFSLNVVKNHDAVSRRRGRGSTGGERGDFEAAPPEDLFQVSALTAPTIKKENLCFGAHRYPSRRLVVLGNEIEPRLTGNKISLKRDHRLFRESGLVGKDMSSRRDLNRLIFKRLAAASYDQAALCRFAILVFHHDPQVDPLSACALMRRDDFFDRHIGYCGAIGRQQGKNLYAGEGKGGKQALDAALSLPAIGEEEERARGGRQAQKSGEKRLQVCLFRLYGKSRYLSSDPPIPVFRFTGLTAKNKGAVAWLRGHALLCHPIFHLFRDTAGKVKDKDAVASSGPPPDLLQICQGKDQQQKNHRAPQNHRKRAPA